MCKQRPSPEHNARGGKTSELANACGKLGLGGEAAKGRQAQHRNTGQPARAALQELTQPTQVANQGGTHALGRQGARKSTHTSIGKHLSQLRMHEMHTCARTSTLVHNMAPAHQQPHRRSIRPPKRKRCIGREGPSPHPERPHPPNRKPTRRVPRERTDPYDWNLVIPGARVGCLRLPMRGGGRAG